MSVSRASRVSSERGARRVTHVAVALTVALATSVAGACASVLGLEPQYEVAKDLCTCVDLLELSFPSCLAHVEGRLGAMQEAERRAYLERYASDCSREAKASCEARVTCLDVAPLCLEAGASCASSLACCGAGSDGGCAGGVCAPSCATCSEVVGAPVPSLAGATACDESAPALAALTLCAEQKSCTCDGVDVSCVPCLEAQCKGALETCRAAARVVGDP